MPSQIDRRALLGAAAAAATLPLVLPARAQTAPAPPALALYAQTPFVDHIALSPDGQRIAVIGQTGDQKFLLHFTATDMKPQRFDLASGKVRGLFWLDNSHVIVTSSETRQLDGFEGNRHEFLQALCVDIDAGKAHTLFTGMDHFYNVVIGDLQRIKTGGGYRVTASSYRMDTSGELELYSFGPDSNIGQVLSVGTPGTLGWLITPEGHPLAYCAFERDKRLWTLYYNLADPGKTNNFKAIYKAEAELHFPDLVGIARDGTSLILQMDSGEYREISSAGVLGEPLKEADTQTGTSLLFHPTTLRHAGYLRRDDWFSYDYFDPTMKKLADALPQVMGEGCRSLIMDTAEDPRRMIIYGESAHDSGGYYYADFTNGDFKPIVQAYPGLPPQWLSDKNPFSYKAADGLAIHAYITVPPDRDAKNLPLVVLPHGGPESRDYIDFDWQAQALASRGYAVLQANFRGSSGYGRDFVLAGHGQWGRKMQTDLSDGVRFLATQGVVDLKRVAIMGASYGGYAALAGATLDPGVYNCAVSIAGPSDLHIMITATADAGGSDAPAVAYWKEFIGNPADCDAISPAKHADKASCPVLLIHGTDDTVVPIEQSKTMEKALKAAGKPVEFITYKGQDHWETIASTRIAMMQAAVDFIAKYNPA